LLAAAPATAQTPTFQHVVVVFQENRTPDNIFGSTPHFLPGVDIQGSGSMATCAILPQQVTLMQNPEGLVTCYDLAHSHQSWNTMCDLAGGGNQCKMDMACGIKVDTKDGGPGCTAPQYPQYQYLPYNVAQPYFEIATTYGFGNYMFQTNQGPSFPAHQFILTGTSAPAPPGNQTYGPDFAAENPAGGGLTYPGEDTGCPAPTHPLEHVADINPQGVEGNYYNSGFPCYTHPSLTDQLSLFPLTTNPNWKYYAPSAGSLWTAPNAIQGLCGNGGQGGGPCTGGPWNSGSSMVLEGGPNGVNTLAPIFTDISSCQLANVSWVVPDGRWSDHAGPSGPRNGNLGLGPAYVASIVNAIGQNPACPGTGEVYWNDTVVIITWDDWGGWYDHVPPFNVVNNGSSWGSSYVYGFRVPLLVVSKWTSQGWVDGALPPYGPGETPATEHDFGSILLFIEKNFGLSAIAPPPYTYADSNAPDGGSPLGPLGNFFTNPSPRTFQPIPLPALYYGFDANYFANYTDGNPPADPDNDASQNED
jgi:hypothetical protein